MTQRGPEPGSLSREDLALMAAYEARTGDSPEGVGPVALDAGGQAELDDLVALFDRIDAVELEPVAPSVRALVMSAAVQQVQAPAHPQGLMALLAALLRPGPMVAMGAVAALAVAVSVRMETAPDRAMERAAPPSMMAMAEPIPTSPAEPEPEPASAARGTPKVGAIPRPHRTIETRVEDMGPSRLGREPLAQGQAPEGASARDEHARAVEGLLARSNGPMSDQERAEPPGPVDAPRKASQPRGRKAVAVVDAPLEGGARQGPTADKFKRAERDQADLTTAQAAGVDDADDQASPAAEARDARFAVPPPPTAGPAQNNAPAVAAPVPTDPPVARTARAKAPQASAPAKSATFAPKPAPEPAAQREAQEALSRKAGQGRDMGTVTPQADGAAARPPTKDAAEPSPELVALQKKIEALSASKGADKQARKIFDLLTRLRSLARERGDSATQRWAERRMAEQQKVLAQRAGDQSSAAGKSAKSAPAAARPAEQKQAPSAGASERE